MDFGYDIEMKIAITGACGGIGSVLAESLFQLNHELVLIDDLSTGSTGNLKNQDLSRSVKKIDISDYSEISALISDCEIIYHLAAISSLPECQKNMTRAHEVNFLATANIANLAMLSGSRLVFASTSAVYERNYESLLSESLQVRPRLVYPQTKFFSELILNSLIETNGLKTSIFRFFNVFAPNQSYSKANPPLINYLVKQHTRGEVANLYARLDSARDYVYVKDVIELLVQVTEPRNFFSGVFNVCSGIESSIANIISSLEKALGSKIAYTLNEPDKLWDNHPQLFSSPNPLQRKIVSQETLKKSLGDPKLTLETFGWKAKHRLEDAIELEVGNMVDLVKKLNS
jgi:UDP-glucose 4-epimerase